MKMELELLGSGTIEVDEKKFKDCRSSAEMKAKKELYDIDQSIKKYELKHHRNKAIMLVSCSIIVLLFTIIILWGV